MASGTTLTVPGTLTIDNSQSSGLVTINTGTIAAQGNISVPDSYSYIGSNSSATLLINGTGAQSITTNASQTVGDLLNVTINKSSGTLTLPSFIRTRHNWVYTAGTIDATTNDSTVVFATGLTITGSHTLNKVTFDPNAAGAYTVTVTSGTTLTVPSTLTFSSSSGGLVVFVVNTGTIAAQGNIVVADSSTYSGSATILINGTGAQSFTGSATRLAGGFPRVDINKSSGTLTLAGTIRTTSNWTWTAGTVDATTNDSTVVFGGSFTITGSQTLDNVIWDPNSAGSLTLTIAAGTTLTVAGNLTIDNSNASGTILSLSGASGALVAQGNVTITTDILASSSVPLTLSGGNNQSINAAELMTATITVNKSGGTATLAANFPASNTGQDLTITSGTLDLAGFNLTVNDVFTLGASGTLQLQGGETVSTIDTVTAGSTVIYNGTGSYTTALAAGNTYSNLTFNGSGGVWEPSSAVTVGAALTISAGTFDIDGQNLTVSGTVSNSGTLRLTGGETTVSLTNDTDSGTVEYDGTGTYASLKAGNSYYHLTISGSGSFTANAANDVNGTFTHTAGTFVAPSSTLTLAGDFSRSGGTFTHNSGTVTLDGSDQTLTGTTTFNNFTKTVSSARTLTFPASTTQTMVGTTTLQGASGALLSLRSSSTDTQWLFDPQGTRSISYVNVKDSQNTNATKIVTAGNNITDAGNNTGWSFNPDPPTSFTGTALSSTSIRWTWTDSSDNETGFKLYDSGNTLIATIATAGATSYTETGLTRGTSYSRYLVAYNEAGNSTASSTVSVTTLTSPPSAPALRAPADEALLATGLPSFSFTKAVDDDDGVASYTVTVGSLTFTGIPASGAASSNPGSATHQTDQYTAQYFRENDGDATNDYITVTLRDAGIATLPLADGEYSWSITAIDAADNSTRSGARSLTVDTTAPTFTTIRFTPATASGTYAYTTAATSPTLTLTVSDTHALHEVSVTFERAVTLAGVITSYQRLQTRTFTLTGTADEVSFTPTEALTTGDTYRATVTVTDTAGNERQQQLTLTVLTAQQTAQVNLANLDADTTPLETIVETLRAALPDTPFSLPDLQHHALVRRERQADEFRAVLDQLQLPRLLAWLRTHTGFMERSLLTSLQWLHNTVAAIAYAFIETTTRLALAAGQHTLHGATQVAGALATNIDRLTWARHTVATAVEHYVSAGVLAVSTQLTQSMTRLSQLDLIGPAERVAQRLDQQSADARTAIGVLQRTLADTLISTATLATRTITSLAALDLATPTQQLVARLAVTENFGRAPLATRHTVTEHVHALSRQMVSARAHVKALAQTTTSAWRTGQITRVREGLKNRQQLAHGLNRLITPAQRLAHKLTLLARYNYEIMFDQAPTKITNVRVTELSPTHAVIEWETTHLTRSGKVNYGISHPYTHEVHLPDTLASQHRAELNDLEPGKNYNFEVSNQNGGYIYDAFYTLTTPVSLDATLVAPLVSQDATITADAVSVRHEPHPTAAVLTTVTRGDSFRALTEQQGWVSILLPNQQTGWVLRDQVELHIHEGDSATQQYSSFGE